jgi:UrcA family protein
MKTCLLALACLASGSALPAHGADEERVTAKVRYADLNVDSAEGAQALLRRIKRAARDVCSPVGGMGLEAHRDFDECVTLAVDVAVADVNKPKLNALLSAQLSVPGA